MSDAKLQRTLLRFQQKIDSAEYYEAHQTLRTITNRYVKSKQYKDAIDLLYQGSAVLSAKKEFGSSSDLIAYLIQVYREANVACSNEPAEKEYKLKLIELISLLPDTDSALADLSKQSISWSSETGDSKFGDANLHHTFGLKFLNASQLEETTATEEERAKIFAFAELHLILGTYESLPHYVGFLFDWYKQSKAHDSTVDAGAFLARAVLNYAYLKNLNFVQEAIEQFLHKIKETQEPFETVDVTLFFENHPLLNFVQLLAVTLSKEGAGDKFLKLYGQYKLQLAANEFTAPVEYLGRLYFNLNLGNPQGGQNMLANLMGGLFK